MRSFRVVTALIMAAGGPLAAQTTGATLRGQVRVADGAGLEGASVEILGTDFKETTGSTGAYRFDHVPAGRYWIAVRRIGYTPLRITITLADTDRRNLQFEMDRLPVRLSELKVVAQGGMTRSNFQDFWARSHSAFGKFLTRDDIATQPGGDLIAIVQRQLPGRSRYALEQRLGDEIDPGEVFRHGGYYLADDGSLLPAGNRTGIVDPDCVPPISINGGSPTPGVSLVDFQPESVEALEIYRRGSWVPTEFAFRESAGCGLIVVWLR